ncbi:MAG: hypothetical protein IJC76_10220 [Lachnospiraceae bacterium]|nr:hypothetical protein [Lachnospiraceae bacterium]
MSADVSFTKGNLDECLSKLAREFQKINGKGITAEIILIGGAAVLANYGFRDMTYDVDGIIRASASMKESINKVGDEMGLPNGWLNSDFVKTKSYSPKLIEYSKFYKRFGYALEVRTISGEYLVAMKLMSGRQYKNDISDIVGILCEHKKQGKTLLIEDIERAVCCLYERWDNLPIDSRGFIQEIMENERYENLYDEYRSNEKKTKESLVSFEKEYPGVVNTDNVSEIIKKLQMRNK